MEFNIEPYNDDFEINAKDNNYLRILFKPGYSVQARELTQIQSILQNQIKSFGDHIFQDGSPVIGGNIALDNSVTYMKLDETYNNEDVELDQYVGQIILRDSDSLVQAKVLAQYYPSGGTPTLLIKYVSGTQFNDGDVFKIAGTTTRAKLIDSAATGKGTISSINDGIFYVDGFFVTITSQTAVVSAYGQNANVKIGLEVNDDVVDYAVDATLLDPAQASFNYQAPGADRYQFSLTLSTRPLETAVDESKFFELMRLENGSITKQVKYSIYSEIEKTLARRTFDESGDYTVVPFRAGVGASPNTNNYMIKIEPGKAYVKGFEFETIGTFRMEVAKPREDGVDSRSLVDIDFNTSYGNYLKFKNVWGSNTSPFLDIDTLERIDLHCVTADNINYSQVWKYANTKIGTAKIRNITRDIPAQDGVAYVDSNGVFNFYFTEIDIKPRVFLATGGTSNTIVIPTNASSTENAYQNTTITVLPIALSNIPNVNTANILAYSARVNANSAVLNVFTGDMISTMNVLSGDIIRVGEETRQVIAVSVDAHGDYLIANAPFTQTIVGTDDSTNPLEVFRQSDYSSNVTNQSRFIERYDGSTKTCYLDRPFDENAVLIADTVVQLNFGIRDLVSIIDTNNTTANATANIAVQSLLINGDTEPFESSTRKLIFPLPKNTVKRESLTNVDYNHTKYIEGINGVSGVFTVNVDATDETFPWSITNSNIEDNLIAVVRTSSGAIANGSVLALSTSEVAGSSTSRTITVPSYISVIDVYTTVKVNNAEGDGQRTKTFYSNTSLSLAPFNFPEPANVTIDHTATINAVDTVKVNAASGLIFVTDAAATLVYPGESINLYVPDVIKVRRILSGSATNTANATNYQDISDHFVVDYGHKDEMYDYAKLTLKQGYPSPNAQLTIQVDYFEHTYAANATFFSVDSYSDAVYQAGTIPLYSSDSGIYFLRDCLDFRPTRRICDPTVVDTCRIPSPDASTELSVDYYLPRIDKLVLSKNKEFRIIKGISSPSPVPPSDEDDSMTLYTIYLPPFVATINDIRMKYNENKRYTMKDISQIDKRVQAIEYYTALNNVENQALADESKYEDGTDKAKFGIIGEGFKNYNIADYTNPDFSVSLKEGEMVPYINNTAYGMKLIPASLSSMVQNKRTLTLSYTEEPMVTQGVTSNKLISVQPFLFAQFIGDISLSPQTDFWVSETLKPDLLRAPEIDDRVREIHAAEVMSDRIVEPPPLVIDEPTTNAVSVIIEVPVSDPPPPWSEDIVPVSLPPDPPLVDSTPKAPRLTQPIKVFDNIDNIIRVLPPPPPPPAPIAPISISTLRTNGTTFKQK